MDPIGSGLPDQGGKTALVTGATGGIGLWTALGLARAGADLTISGRSAERLAAASRWIAEHGGKRPPRTELADFSSLKAVRDMAARLSMRLDRLDILVNNAGLMTTSRQLSADGYEMTFAVNHLAPFLLTRNLLALLRRAPSARIVTVASTAHRRGRIAWDDLMAERGYGTMRSYAQSKLANILFTNELARRLAGTRATANAVHPGLVGTGFGDVGGITGFGWRLGRWIMLSPRRGADTSLYVATAPELAGVTGKYFARRRPVTPAEAARDPQAAARLWRLSAELVDRALA